MNGQVEIERRVKLLIEDVDSIRDQIDMGEYDHAASSARSLARECDSLNQFANRLADAS